MLMDKHTHEIFYEKLTFIYLEIPKFKKGEDELASLFDKWLYVLKNLSEFKEKPKKLQEKIFEKLFEEAEIAKLKPEDMRKYEESLKTYRDNNNTLEYAKKESKAEGREEEKIEIAKMLKKNGVSDELIAKSTGLTQEQIEKLI
jgi:predicted transposase/invertase (TIGR01784 family)